MVSVDSRRRTHKMRSSSALLIAVRRELTTIEPQLMASSTRFIVFDENAKIITEHQTEFEQILPHAGWHEQDPIDLVDAMRECINRAMHKLEFMGWQQESVKGIGTCGSQMEIFADGRNHQPA